MKERIRKRVRKASTLRRITLNKLVTLCKGKQVYWTASNRKTAHVTHALVYARRDITNSILADTIARPSNAHVRLYVADSGSKGQTLAYIEQRNPIHTTVYLISE